MEAAPEEGVATILVGAEGTGLISIDGDIEEDVPVALIAVIVNVYDVPFVNPDIIIGLDEPVAVILPGDETTV